MKYNRILLKLSGETLSGSDGKGIDPIQIRQLSRKFASDTIKKQKKAMSQWGIMCDISFYQLGVLDS